MSFSYNLGQEVGSEVLPDDFVYPSMEELAEQVILAGLFLSAKCKRFNRAYKYHSFRSMKLSIILLLYIMLELGLVLEEIFLFVMPSRFILQYF